MCTDVCMYISNEKYSTHDRLNLLENGHGQNTTWQGNMHSCSNLRDRKIEGKWSFTSLWTANILILVDWERAPVVYTRLQTEKAFIPTVFISKHTNNPCTYFLDGKIRWNGCVIDSILGTWVSRVYMCVIGKNLSDMRSWLWEIS